MTRIYSVACLIEGEDVQDDGREILGLDIVNVTFAERRGVKGEAMRFILYQDASGQWRWRLRAGNNRIIADSGEGYVEQRDARRAISQVKRTNASTRIEVDATEAQPASQ